MVPILLIQHLMNQIHFVEFDFIIQFMNTRNQGRVLFLEWQLSKARVLDTHQSIADAMSCSCTQSRLY